jgi:UDPglucose--hexose-1-phosphate uridylyltransferase
MDFSDLVHRRQNSLTGRWVLVSPHRAQRPWLGQIEPQAAPDLQVHDADCYLCPGNKRANGATNPNYEGPWAFQNDFPALLLGSNADIEAQDLFRAEVVIGECRVICFSPNHSLTLPQLSKDQVRSVIDCWVAQSSELGTLYTCVLLFENKGAAMGCSNPHPHGQLWASSHIPDEPAIEDERQRAYLAENGHSLLTEVAAREAGGPRVVIETPDWLVIVPWWAVWPFETLLMPRFSVQRIEHLNAAQRDGLADVLRELTARYDNLFGCPFPYSMGWHGAPYLPGDHSHWILHAHFYPPLLRSATVRKFMVGYEMLAEAQRDLTPEQAAERLRRVSPTHYSLRDAQ